MSQPQPASNPAQTYEEYFVPGMFRPWTDELLDRAEPRPGERILDLACGTGIVARIVARRLAGRAAIVGLDLSPGMLEVARAAATAEGAEVDFRQGSAEALPFADGAFDLVLIQHGLQFFPDKAAALAEAHRALAPGGRVASSTWTGLPRNPFNEAFSEAIRRHLGSPVLHTPFSLGDRDELRGLFAAAGFAETAIETVQRSVHFASPERFVDLGIAGAAAAVPAMQAMDEAARARLSEAIRAEMREPLRKYTDGERLVHPMEANITVARKPERDPDRATA